MIAASGDTDFVVLDFVNEAVPSFLFRETSRSKVAGGAVTIFACGSMAMAAIVLVTASRASLRSDSGWISAPGRHPRRDRNAD